MSVFELASGDFLVISPAGVRTLVYGRPYALERLRIVRRLRVIADTIERAEAATAPLKTDGSCEPA